MTEIALTDWHAETLRLSAFMVDAIAPTDTPEWQELLGTVPEEQRNQPQQQLNSENGPYLGGRLQVDIRPTRYDWILYPDPNIRSAEFSSLGSYASLEGQFRELMLTWLASRPAIHRLAFAGVFLLPSESVVDVYSRLDRLLPAVQIDRANTRDLTYRINRRRKSRCGGGWTRDQSCGNVVCTANNRHAS